MTMFLMNTVQAEVEPVLGQAGWFQLNGKGILREMQPCEELLNECRDLGSLVDGAKLLGLHDVDSDIERQDPRFNDEDEPGFGVVKHDAGYTMYLSCNRAEYVLFRFLVPMSGGEKFDTEYDDISNYRK